MALAKIFGTDQPDAPDLTTAMAFWTPRIDRFNDLFSIGPVAAFATLNPPPLRQWTWSPEALANFFQWLMDQADLERNRFD